jgi:hypothetical protein
MREQQHQTCCPTHRPVGTMGRQEMILVEKEEYLVRGLLCGNVNNELPPLLPLLRAMVLSCSTFSNPIVLAQLLPH